jgi:hypothetical protein
VSDTPDFEKSTLCAERLEQGKTGEEMKIACAPGVRGRYVRVRLNTNNALTLCEVKVFGPKPAAA